MLLEFDLLVHLLRIDMNDKSCDLLFDTLFISLDPNYVMFPLLHAQITEQRLATFTEIFGLLNLNYTILLFKSKIQI